MTEPSNTAHEPDPTTDSTTADRPNDPSSPKKPLDGGYGPADTPGTSAASEAGGTAQQGR